MRPFLPLILALTFAAAARAQDAGPPGSSSVAAAAPPAADAGPPALCTDRPTKSNSACAVEPGYWQLETDLVNGAFQRQGGVTTDTWLVTNPTLKYGLIKNLDVEVNIAPYEIVRTRAGSTDHTDAGLGDLFLRVKYTAYSNADGSVQIGLFPYVKAPTAPLGVGNRAWEGGASLPINLTLSPQWGLTFSPEVDVFKDQVGDGRHLNTSQTVNLSYALPKDVTVYGELWADWNFDPAGEVRQASLDFAVTKLLNKLFKVDAGVNLGLNRATPGVQVYAGLSQKW